MKVAAGLLCLYLAISNVTTNYHALDKRQTENGIELEDVGDYLLKNLDTNNIRSNLRFLTKKPHLGGTPQELVTAQWVEDTWKHQGMDKVHKVPYNVMLSYPNKEKPNELLMRYKDDVIWEAANRHKPLYTPEEYSEEVPFPYNAYSVRGDVTGDIVYANYGREEDFKHLEEVGINITGCLVIARYGKIFRANIASFAEKRGAVGVILFSDPGDFAPLGTENTYPKSVMMPPPAISVGSVKLMDGDPLTPFYPSIESAFHIPEDEAAIPKIPVQPINYEDAQHIIGLMKGDECPESWRGGINATYRYGPGLQEQSWSLNLRVFTESKNVVVYNVIGVLRGLEEPDRYVLIGNHRDAWIFGAIDPSSATAAMVELSRVLLELKKEKSWRPRRSIVFCSWGAEEFGLVGSQEWTEQFGKQLADRAVAYLNVDMILEGKYILGTRNIENPDPEERAQGRMTVYDTWASRRPDDERPGYPEMLPIGSGSDYKGFQHNLGIPCMDVRYTHSNVTIGDPMYHTLYETFAVVDELYDKGFHFHKAVTSLWGLVAISLSDSKILPLSLREYVQFINKSQIEIFDKYYSLLESKNISFGYFTDALRTFNETVISFETALQTLDLSNPLLLRKVNDQIMMVERAFLDYRGLPDRPDYNHVVSAPSIKNAYAGTAFPGLVDTLQFIVDESDETEKEKLWRTFEEHLAVVTFLLHTAASILTDDLW